jgi:hypothetical protein
MCLGSHDKTGHRVAIIRHLEARCVVLPSRPPIPGSLARRPGAALLGRLRPLKRSRRGGGRHSKVLLEPDGALAAYVVIGVSRQGAGTLKSIRKGP